METVSLKMDSDLIQDIDSAINKHRYSTRTEFIRDAIRTKLSELEKEEIMKKLAEFKGSLKPKNNLTDGEIRDLVGRKIAKKYGIELD